jgi:hypothetical protein
MAEHSGSSRGFLISVLALVVALVAVGLAIWGLVKTPSQSEQVFTGTATDDPKGAICDAFNVVRNGVQINTNLQPPGGPQDITGSMAVAANARVALYDGGQYLLARLQPDTPADLADAVRTVDLGHSELRAGSGGASEGSGHGQRHDHQSLQVSTRLT